MSRMFPVGLLISLLVATGCSSKNPSAPSTGTASVAAPRSLTPTNLAQIANNAQPVTLVVQNAIVTQSGGTTYAFEIASDAAFANKVQTRSGVAEGGGGQTSVTLSALPAGATYYWHAQATGGGTTGVFGAGSQFTIGPLISISPPAPVSPANGASTTTQPTLTVSNAAHSGPVGLITYRFDISTSATFANVNVTSTVAEGTSQTSFTPPSPLTLNATYYWRVTAVDVTNVVASPPSAVQSFTASMQPITVAGAIAAQEGLVLWPGTQPPGTAGHAQLGNGWGVGVIRDYTGATFLNPVLDALRVFDLLDRGLDPQGALDWLHANGYSNSGAYYGAVLVVGFPQEYMALINGQWDMVVKLGA
jgi:hypothetical protein